MSNNYTTNFVCNGTDLGTILAPDFSNTISNSITSPFNPIWIDNGVNITPTHTGMYLLNFNVSFVNTATKQTPTVFGLTTNSITTDGVYNIICQFSSYMGNYGSIGSQTYYNLNGPWTNSAYVHLNGGTPYYFFVIVVGTDTTAFTYTINMNNISAVVP